MEFPQVGENCAVADCKQIDFLPFVCSHCSDVFCKNHFQAFAHNCSKCVDKFVENPAESTLKNFKCSQESCEESSPVEIACVECKKHYCVGHRYHGCLEMSQEEKLSKLKKWQRPKAEFAIAKTAVDEHVKEALKKSKNVAMANKVQLMKLKGKANGAKTIPTAHRRYFQVYPPRKNCPKSEEPRALFVSMDWTIGKVMDTFAKAFHVFTSANQAPANSEKLGLFHYATGKMVAEKMDTPLLELLENETLIDGQSLILEYSTESDISTSPYK